MISIPATAPVLTSARKNARRIKKRVQPQHRKAALAGWVRIKQRAGLCQTKLRGTARVGWSFTLAAAAYNLVRLPVLLRPAT
jgi:hypothetical protein